MLGQSGSILASAGLAAVAALGLTGAVSGPAAAARGNPLCFRMCVDTCGLQREFCVSNAPGRSHGTVNMNASHPGLSDASSPGSASLCGQHYQFCTTQCRQSCNWRLN